MSIWGTTQYFLWRRHHTFSWLIWCTKQVMRNPEIRHVFQTTSRIFRWEETTQLFLRIKIWGTIYSEIRSTKKAREMLKIWWTRQWRARKALLMIDRWVVRRGEEITCRSLDWTLINNLKLSTMMCSTAVWSLTRINIDKVHTRTSRKIIME